MGDREGPGIMITGDKNICKDDVIHLDVDLVEAYQIPCLTAAEIRWKKPSIFNLIIFYIGYGVAVIRAIFTEIKKEIKLRIDANTLWQILRKDFRWKKLTVLVKGKKHKARLLVRKEE